MQVCPRALSASEVSTLYGLGQGGGDVSSGKLTTSWTLDQRGLPTSMTNADGYTTDYSYDEAGRLAVTTQPSVTTEAYGGTPGTARPVTMAGYDTFGDTAESEDANGNVTTCGYAFSYLGSTQTLASDGVNTYTWDPSGSSLTGIGVVGGTSDGVLAFTNTHGDVVGQFTSSGSSVSGSTGYDPWGNTAGTTGTVTGRLGFQSGWTDPATQKVAMGAS